MALITKFIKNKTSNPSIDKLLKEATCNKDINPPYKVLLEISKHTYAYKDLDKVLKRIWSKLGSEKKKWRKIYKTLHLIEHLIKNGAPKCIEEFREGDQKIRNLHNFTYSENGQDRGVAIRELSRRIIHLLSNEQLIQEEQERAKEMNEKLKGIQGHGSVAQKTSPKKSSPQQNIATKNGNSNSGKKNKEREGSVSSTEENLEDLDCDLEDEKKIVTIKVRNSENYPKNDIFVDKEDANCLYRVGTRYSTTKIDNTENKIEERQEKTKSTTVILPPPTDQGVIPLSKSKSLQPKTLDFSEHSDSPMNQVLSNSTKNQKPVTWNEVEVPQPNDNIWNFQRSISTPQSKNSSNYEPSPPNPINQPRASCPPQNQMNQIPFQTQLPSNQQLPQSPGMLPINFATCPQNINQQSPFNCDQLRLSQMSQDLSPQHEWDLSLKANKSLPNYNQNVNLNQFNTNSSFSSVASNNGTFSNYTCQVLERNQLANSGSKPERVNPMKPEGADPNFAQFYKTYTDKEKKLTDITDIRSALTGKPVEKPLFQSTESELDHLYLDIMDSTSTSTSTPIQIENINRATGRTSCPMPMNNRAPVNINRTSENMAPRPSNNPFQQGNFQNNNARFNRSATNNPYVVNDLRDAFKNLTPFG